MNISEILSIQKGASLIDTVEKIDQKLFLDSILYKINEGLYLHLTKFSNGRFATDPMSLFIDGVLCTPDDGSARRVCNFLVEADSGMILNVPKDLIPQYSDFKYKEILDFLRTIKSKICQETATYRIAADGLFVHKKIETERYTFYFRKEQFDDNELPYAVLVKFY